MKHLSYFLRKIIGYSGASASVITSLTAGIACGYRDGVSGGFDPFLALEQGKCAIAAGTAFYGMATYEKGEMLKKANGTLHSSLKAAIGYTGLLASGYLLGYAMGRMETSLISAGKYLGCLNESLSNEPKLCLFFPLLGIATSVNAREYFGKLKGYFDERVKNNQFKIFLSKE